MRHFNQNIFNINTIVSSLMCSLIICMSVSCKKLIEIEPPIESIVGSEIYKSNTNAAAVLTGIYTDMSKYGIFTGQNSISVKCGLSADEFVPVTEPGDILTSLYENALTNNGHQLFWTDLYAFIFRANAAIEGLNAATSLTSDVKNRLLGEAKFIRAFMYFYLVNFYGDVPLIISTDLKLNSVMARTNKDLVYMQIENDLLDAQQNLVDEYLSANIQTVTPDRLRPNKSAATSLLARVYLFQQKWIQAEQEADKVISNNSLYSLEPLAGVFLNTSKEAIWQLQSVYGPSSFEYNTIEGVVLNLLPRSVVDNGGPSVPQGRPVYMNKLLYNDFDAVDNRKANWLDSIEVAGVTYPYALKYKQYTSGVPRTEHLMVFRLAEQYLIRAEARAQQGKVNGVNSAAEDLNIIRHRAGLGDTNASSQTDMLTALLNERRRELFMEWGHRWLDLKRTGDIDEIMNVVCPLKGGSWQSYKSLYPIPVSDIQNNPSLRGHQNTGYPEQ